METFPFRSQPLLFRQVCILAAAAGLMAFRFPAHGLLACLLLALLALPVHASRPHLPERRRAILLLVSFCLGLLFALMTAQQDPLPNPPAWVRAAATPPSASSTDVVDADPSYKQGVPLTGIIRENTPIAGGRHRILMDDVKAAGENEALPGLLVLTWLNPPPGIAGAGPGQRLSAVLNIRHIRGFANPGSWKNESYWRDRGAYFRSWTSDNATRKGKTIPYTLEGETSFFWKSRASLREAVIAILAGETKNEDGSPAVSQAAAIIPALLFGDRSFCSPETLDLVTKATLTHSLALSGMHLGFAAALGYAAAHLIYLIFPALFTLLPRQKAGLIMALPVAALYLWLGGAPPSLVRAALMLLFWGILLWLNKPKALIDGLIWAVALILLFSPDSIFDIRLQLSAVSVAGIAIASPLLQRLAMAPDKRLKEQASGTFFKVFSRLIKVVAGMALISIAAQAAILPIVLDAFPGTGMWFPLNLIWLPVLGMIVMPLAFAGLLMTIISLPALAFPLFFLAKLPCSALLALLQSMDAVGLLVAPVFLRPAFPAMAGYWLLILLIPPLLRYGFTRRSVALLMAGLILTAAPSLCATIAERPDTVRLRLLDVGQGQSVLVSWNSDEVKGRMLIDGGGIVSPTFDLGKGVVTSVLTDNAAPKLDWLVNTHPDVDHLQGLLFVLDTFSIGQVAFGPDSFNAKQTQTTLRRDAILNRRAIKPELWKAGDSVVLAPDLILEILHSGEDANELSSNDSSIVLRLVRHGRPLALICGDVGAKGIKMLLQSGTDLRADLLVIPHHGSAGSFSPKLYDSVDPKLALVSCGYGNIWNFPAVKVRKALAERNIPLAATSDKGHITITWDAEDNIRVDWARANFFW